MDKTAIRKFAVEARKKLIEGVKQKAFELGITEEKIIEPDIYRDGFMINQTFYKKHEIEQRKMLVQYIMYKGYKQVMEEVAYTWFNRFIAIRFMEVNDYLPTGIRMFSSLEPGKAVPDSVTEVEFLIDDLQLDEQEVFKLQDTADDEALFKYIFIKQCNQLGELMPFMFERIEDYTELLLPNQLLAKTSVVTDLVNMIDEEDWKKEVEIIGWLYQYYISEKKDEVFAGLRKNKKITKENVPAATELFTPRWIVQYMVDNSLGRLWLESHPDDSLQQKLVYYVDDAKQSESIVKQVEALKDPSIQVEQMKFFDPAMGSGHILVYAFELFYHIYKSQGYPERDIPKLIIENNLYGVDIDPRAAQLAYFALLMKGRQYNHRFFSEPIQTNVYWIEESNALTNEDIDIFIGDTDLKQDVQLLIDTFQDARLYGSILNIPDLNLSALKERVQVLKDNEYDDMFVMAFKDNSLSVIERLVKQAKILSATFDIVVTNPPYMGRKGMHGDLVKYVRKHYKESSADMYAVFMEVASRLLKEKGFLGMINQHSWMFLSSFEKLRKQMLKNHQIYSMAHLGTRAFAEIGGEVVQTTSFVMRKNPNSGFIATFIRLVDIPNAEEKAKQFFNQELYYRRTQDGFSDIPGSPIAYWASERVREIFRRNPELKQFTHVKKGSFTGDNNRFLRFWFEVFISNIGFKMKSRDSAKKSKRKWFPYNKGGAFRKWYGNHEYIINWLNDGSDIKNFVNSKGEIRSGIRNPKFYFQEKLSWSDVSTGDIGVRYYPKGFINDATGPSIFLKEPINMYNLLGYTNSKVLNLLTRFTMSTMHFNNGTMAVQPYKVITNKSVESLVKQNISITKSDWDSFETSWDFKTHPFIEFKKEAKTLEEANANWEQEQQERFQTLKENEEELNRIFIDLYGLQDELTPEVDDADVTVSQPDQERDVKSFLSYAVGIMFGRYSLDELGLIYAGGEFNREQYKILHPDGDNVIPITDELYFEDDIVNRLIEIMIHLYGKDFLEANLNFIADTLKKRANETSRQRIRRYFLKEFYKDHVRTYKKRPIYWLFNSGKQDGFKALVYVHRYQPDLVSCVRISYLHKQMKKYEEEMEHLEHIFESDVSRIEKSRAKKRKEKLQKQLMECRHYDQVIANVAHREIDLDLDDGVKVNYAKFQNIEVPRDDGKAPLKENILAKM